MKKNAEAKVAKGELSELMMAVARIAEKLETLEKKTDLVLSQMSSRAFEGREHPKPVLPAVVVPQTFRQPEASQRPDPTKPAQADSRGPARERREKVLHKAVCADCHQNCEIPFKPTGDRPVYCKKCFSKRKGNHSFKGDHGDKQAPSLPTATEPDNPPQRKVIVTKKGVGKVTVSEIVHSSAHDMSHKGKSHNPAKKPER